MKSRIDISTVGGLILGFGAIFGSFLLEGGTMGALLLGPAMIIVFGGTIAAAMIGTTSERMRTVPFLIKLSMVPPQFEVKQAIEDLVRYASISRRDGLLSLEKELHRVENAFMRKFLRHAIDGTDPEVLQEIVNTELDAIAERHAQGANLFVKMGGYSPTMGIIGTVMGLITTLASAGSEPDMLIRHIATAFVATLWGVFMANLVWLPIADKLKYIHSQEAVYLEIITDGVMAIQAGEIPSVIKAKLNSKLPEAQQEVD